MKTFSLLGLATLFQICSVRAEFGCIPCRTNETTEQLKEKCEELNRRIKPLITGKFPSLSDTLPKRAKIFVCIQQLLTCNSEIRALISNINELPQDTKAKKRENKLKTLGDMKKTKSEKIGELVELLEYDLTNLLGLVSRSDNVVVLQSLIEDMERDCSELKKLHDELAKLKSDMKENKNALRGKNDPDIGDVQQEMNVIQRLTEFNTQIDLLKMSLVDINELIKAIKKNEQNDKSRIKGFEGVENVDKLKEKLQHPAQLKKLKKIRGLEGFNLEILERFKTSYSRDNGIYIIKKLVKEFRSEHISELVAEIHGILTDWSQQSENKQKNINDDIQRVDNLWKDRGSLQIIGNVFQECTNNVKTQFDELNSLLELHCKKYDTIQKEFDDIEASKLDINNMFGELRQQKKNVEEWLERQTTHLTDTNRSIKAIIDLSKREFEVKLYRMGLQLNDTLHEFDTCLETLCKLDLLKRDLIFAFDTVKQSFCELNLKHHNIEQHWVEIGGMCALSDNTLEDEDSTTTNCAIESEVSAHLQILKVDVSDIVQRFNKFRELFSEQENKQNTLVILLTNSRRKLNETKTALKNELNQIPDDMLHIEKTIENAAKQKQDETNNESNHRTLSGLRDSITTIQAN